MSMNGDAAEQVVRLTLEGTEVVAKLTGKAAEKIAIALIAAMKQPQKTKGKARLSQMLRSGKALKVYSVKQENLKVFQEQAKRYGILYCVLRNPNHIKDPNAEVDIFIRSDDESRVSRIAEKFNFATTHRADYVKEAERTLEKTKESLKEKQDSPFQEKSDVPSGKDSQKSRSSQNERPFGGGATTEKRESMKIRIERNTKAYKKEAGEKALKSLERANQTMRGEK